MEWDKLTEEERKHLTEDAGVTSLEDLRLTRKGQKELQATDPNSREVCWTCRIIAKKLGIEE